MTDAKKDETIKIEVLEKMIQDYRLLLDDAVLWMKSAEEEDTRLMLPAWVDSYVASKKKFPKSLGMNKKMGRRNSASPNFPSIVNLQLPQ